MRMWSDIRNRRGLQTSTSTMSELNQHLPELHNLGNDLEEWAEIRVRKDFIPKGARLVEAYQTEREVIVMGHPAEGDESHNCDAMGCGSLSHVMFRFPIAEGGQMSDPTTNRAESRAFLDDCVRARELWGLRSSWARGSNGECDADRAWSGLVWSATMHSRDGNFSERDQTALEAAQYEYGARVKLSLGMFSAKAKP